jgi:sentrin-specific protease 7
MLQLFKTPLQPKNEKIGTSALVEDPTEHSRRRDRESDGTSNRPLLDQLKRAADGPAPSAQAGESTTSMRSTRPSRARGLAPTHYVEDTPTYSDVPKYSVETGLGQPWTR